MATPRKKPATPKTPGAELTQEALIELWQAWMHQHDAVMAVQIVSPLGRPLPIDSLIPPGFRIQAWPQLRSEAEADE